ncbi:MAG TPA: archaeal heat shock protein Hsp20 [Nitrososphaerales archaeon]|nr:archaeal heat shock protein Hsp20 [Nitrososphaerales archaeon]
MSEDDDERDDYPARRRRGYPFGPWGFPDMDDMMKEMERAFSEQFKELEKEMPKGLVRESKTPEGGTKKEIGPIVYGYSVTIGPDGKPVVREFGNVRKGEGTPWKAINDSREPLVDVVSSDKEVRVIAEIPGVKKEDIELTIDEKSIEISVEGDRRYHKELELPGVVDPKGAKSSYNNGVLEITIPLKSPRKGGVKLRVD